MNISFSTICPKNAETYLAHERFAYLSETQKLVALKHLGQDKLRVQDPNMYPSPKLEITTREVYDEIMNANTDARGAK